MVRHIVAWSFKDEISQEDRAVHALKIKADLEALPKVIGEIKEMKVYTDLLPSSNRSLSLSSVFESAEGLQAYVVHPEHQKVAAFIKSVTQPQERLCLDYYE